MSDQPTCCVCGRAEELRPYGPGGAPICFECATSSPEREAQAEAAFGAIFNAAEAVSPTGTAVIGAGHSGGPDPFDARTIDPNADVIHGNDN